MNGNNQPGRKRVAPGDAPLIKPDQPVFQMALLPDGQYAMSREGLSNAQVIQILFGAITQMMFVAFPEKEQPMVQPAPMGMQVPPQS